MMKENHCQHIVYKKSMEIAQDFKIEQIDMSKYPKGNYIIKVNINNRKAITQKLLKM